MFTDSPSNAFHCLSCDVWGALPECWCCGRTALLSPEKLRTTGGMHSHREHQKWVQIYGVSMKIDDAPDKPFE